MLAGIRRETGRMGDLVADLLLLARLDEEQAARTRTHRAGARWRLTPLTPPWQSIRYGP